MNKRYAIILLICLAFAAQAQKLQKTQLFPSTSPLQPLDEIQDPYIKEQFSRTKQWADKLQQMLDETFRKISLNLLWTLGDDDNIYREDGSVGIGTTSPDTKLQVVGTAGFGDDSGNETLVSATGDVTFAGTAGLAFGCINGLNETITCTTQNTWYQVTFDTAGATNLVEADVTNNELDVTNAGAGVYQVFVTACFHTNPSNDYELMVKKNDGASDLMPHLYQTTAVANQVENTSGACLVDVTGATDRLELWVRCTSAAAQDAVFDHVSLTITQIGGT